MLNLGCTLPNIDDICLHKSISAKCQPFIESIKNVPEKVRKDMVVGLLIVLKRKALVDETFNRMSSNICESNIESDASQFYPYSISRPMPTRIYTRFEFKQTFQAFKCKQSKTRIFEKMVLSYFQWFGPECKIRSFYTTGNQKNIDCFTASGPCKQCNTIFEAMLCLHHFCSCQAARLSITEKTSNAERKLDQWTKCEKKASNKIA